MKSILKNGSHLNQEISTENYHYMEFFTLPDLDSMKEYSRYKPWNNITKVTERMQKLLVQKNQKKILDKKDQV